MSSRRRRRSLAPEDFVVAVGVKGRVYVDEVHAGVGELTQLVEVVAAVDDAGVHEGRRFASRGGLGHAASQRIGDSVCFPRKICSGGAVVKPILVPGASRNCRQFLLRKTRTNELVRGTPCFSLVKYGCHAQTRLGVSWGYLQRWPTPLVPIPRVGREISRVQPGRIRAHPCHPWCERLGRGGARTTRWRAPPGAHETSHMNLPTWTTWTTYNLLWCVPEPATTCWVPWRKVVSCGLTPGRARVVESGESGRL